MTKSWKIDRAILRSGRDIAVLTRTDGTGVERFPDAEEVKAACLALNGTVEGIEALQAQLSTLRADLERMTAERDGLHAQLKAVVDYAIDVLGKPTSAMLGPDAPLRVMRKLHEDLVRCRIERDVFSSDNLRAERDSALAARDKAHADCQEMIRLNDELTKERDVAIAERDAALVLAEIRDVAIAERDAALVLAEIRGRARDAACLDRDNIEARIVSTLDAAFAGPESPPLDMSAEVARIVNAVRVRERMLATATARAEQAAATEREACAAWLDKEALDMGKAMDAAPTTREAVECDQERSTLEQAAKDIRAGRHKEKP